jgi:superfamily I DNA/RNA helicase
VRTKISSGAPRLDEQQQAVVTHRGGPLLVLAGPGTGKTTTLVEAMIDRLTGVDACSPDQVVGLTFARDAAAQWRDRVAVRLGGAAPQVSTFHSFAFAVVRKFPEALKLQGAPRLLAGYEEQSTVREIVHAALAIGQLPFPDDLRAAVLTTEFGRQLRAAMARARSVGLDGSALMAAAAGDPAWTLAARLLQQYESYLEDRDAFDYSSLVVAATAALQQPEISSQVHRQLRAVFVDEYQDTDPSQVDLLRAIVGPTCDVTVVGDPDQSIYAFRGADVGAIFRFSEDFGSPQRPSRTIVLRTCRRFGPDLRAVADVGLSRVQYPGVIGWSDMREVHRSPTCVGGARFESEGVTPERGERVPTPRDETALTHESPLTPAVNVVVCASARVEAGLVAERIARLQQQGTPLQEIAVLVRTSSQIPVFARTLTAAGIPASVDGDEAPVADNSAVGALLEAATFVENPHSLTVQSAYSLLYSPMCGVDPADVRFIIRELRALERREDPACVPTSSDDLVRALVGDRTSLAKVRAGRADEGLRRLKQWHEICDAARAVRTLGGSPEQVLWALWSAAGGYWPLRLRAAALRGGAAGRQADRDLDAVTTLFDMARKASHTKAKSVSRFVDEVRAQGIGVASATAAALIQQVRVMTAHRAKGLEWDVVFVCGVQDAIWPNVRPRGGMLAADRVTQHGLDGGLTASTLMAEERRLFYVALTRARRQAWVTCVDAPASVEEGNRASVFVRELVEIGETGDVSARVPQVNAWREQRQSVRTLNLPDVVAALRFEVSDRTKDESRRREAAKLLARLSEVPHSGAHPDEWWGLAPRTSSNIPVRPDGALRLSGTALKDLSECTLRWFLEREVGAASEKTTALVFGSLVHTLCEQIALNPDIEPEVESLIDSVWPAVSYDAPWISASQRTEVSAAMHRFVSWQQSMTQQTGRMAGVEVSFDTELRIVGPDGQPREIRLTGSMDRVQVAVDDAGEHATVYDFKTNSKNSVPSSAEVAEHIQLLTYQAVLRSGNISDVPEPDSVDAGLVFLRVSAGAKSSHLPKVMTQRAADKGSTGDAHFAEVVADAVDAIRAESFTASPGEHCAFCPLRSACPAHVTESFAVADGEEAGADAD